MYPNVPATAIKAKTPFQEVEKPNKIPQNRSVPCNSSRTLGSQILDNPALKFSMDDRRSNERTHPRTTASAKAEPCRRPDDALPLPRGSTPRSGGRGCHHRAFSRCRAFARPSCPYCPSCPFRPSPYICSNSASAIKTYRTDVPDFVGAPPLCPPFNPEVHFGVSRREGCSPLQNPSESPPKTAIVFTAWPPALPPVSPPAFEVATG